MEIRRSHGIHYTKMMLRYLRQIHPQVYNEALEFIHGIDGQIIDIDDLELWRD